MTKPFKIERLSSQYWWDRWHPLSWLKICLAQTYNIVPYEKRIQCCEGIFAAFLALESDLTSQYNTVGSAGKFLQFNLIQAVNTLICRPIYGLLFTVYLLSHAELGMRNFFHVTA